MTHEQEPQPQPNPDAGEQLLHDFGDQQPAAQVEVYDWSQEVKDTTGPNTPEAVADSEISPARLMYNGVKSAMRDVRSNRQANKARRNASKTHAGVTDTDDAEPTAPDTTEPESAFAKFTRETKENRPSRRKRAADRRQARKDSKQTAAKDSRIAQLDDELSGASSTIGKRVKKLDDDGNVIRDKDGKTVWGTERVMSMRTYKLDEQGKKHLMTNVEKIAYEQKVEELNALRGVNPATAEVEPTKVDMSDDEFTTFLEKLNDEQTETIQKLMDANADLTDKLNAMTNQERKDFIDAHKNGEPLVADMTDDEFSDYLNTLSDTETDAIQALMDKDTDLTDKLNAMTNQERKDFLDGYIQGELNGNALADWRDLADESGLELHDLKRFFEAASDADLKMIESYSPADKDTHISMWLNDNPREKAADYMTEDLFNEFVDSLSEEDYETFVSIPESEQNQWALDWYKDEKYVAPGPDQRFYNNDGTVRPYLIDGKKKITSLGPEINGELMKVIANGDEVGFYHLYLVAKDFIETDKYTSDAAKASMLADLDALTNARRPLVLKNKEELANLEANLQNSKMSDKKKDKARNNRVFAANVEYKKLKVKGITNKAAERLQLTQRVAARVARTKLHTRGLLGGSGDKKPGVIKRSAKATGRAVKATGRGADRTLDFMANNFGRYSMPKDKK